MKEHPILFSDTMVRAILAGSKTQTRRIVKPQPLWVYDDTIPVKTQDADPKGAIRCPYGVPGDRLWVRETWQALTEPNPSHLIAEKPQPGDDIRYRATEPETWIPALPWRPSIHMPRWACRLVLEITDVRVERLQDISRQDALAEGIDMSAPQVASLVEEYRPVIAFAGLWESINAKRAPWKSNPWVWVIEFEEIEA
jgi:hypothetical protein